MISRRAMIVGGASALAGCGAHLHTAHAAEKSFLSQGLPDGVYDTATLDALPGKRPLISFPTVRRITRHRFLFSRRN